MKQTNSYKNMIDPELYRNTPKAVYAAVAVSFLVNHQHETWGTIDSALIDEWKTLHSQGLVPQKPPKRVKR